MQSMRFNDVGGRARQLLDGHGNHGGRAYGEGTGQEGENAEQARHGTTSIPPVNVVTSPFDVCSTTVRAPSAASGATTAMNEMPGVPEVLVIEVRLAKEMSLGPR